MARISALQASKAGLLVTDKHTRWQPAWGKWKHTRVYTLNGLDTHVTQAKSEMFCERLRVLLSLRQSDTEGGNGLALTPRAVGLDVTQWLRRDR